MIGSSSRRAQASTSCRRLSARGATSGRSAAVRTYRAGSWGTGRPPPTTLVRDGVSRAVLFGGGPLEPPTTISILQVSPPHNRWLADSAATIPSTWSRCLPADAGHRPVHPDAERGRRAWGIRRSISRPSTSKTGTAGGGSAAQVLAVTGDPDGELQYDNSGVRFASVKMPDVDSDWP